MVQLPPNTVLQERYRIIRQIGQGGMGAVYEAADLRLNSTVALKQTLVSGQLYAQAFEREAQILCRLRHAALPRVIDHFIDANGQFLVMEYIIGEDLATLMERYAAPLPVEQVLNWGDQLLAVLEYLHTQQPPIIHRDIKPQNLKLSPRGELFLLDFGLAKEVGPATGQSVIGYTVNYTPPEQIQGTGSGPRSDLFATGATLYHLLTQEAAPPAHVRAAVVTSGAPDPLRLACEQQRHLAPALVGVLLQAMELNPNQRFPDATTMRSALRQVLQSPAANMPPPTTRRLPMWLPWGVGIVAVALVLVIFGVVLSSQRGSSNNTATTAIGATVLATTNLTTEKVPSNLTIPTLPSDAPPTAMATPTPTTTPTVVQPTAVVVEVVVPPASVALTRIDITKLTQPPPDPELAAIYANCNAQRSSSSTGMIVTRDSTVTDATLDFAFATQQGASVVYGLGQRMRNRFNMDPQCGVLTSVTHVQATLFSQGASLASRAYPFAPNSIYQVHLTNTTITLFITSEGLKTVKASAEEQRIARECTSNTPDDALVIISADPNGTVEAILDEQNYPFPMNGRPSACYAMNPGVQALQLNGQRMPVRLVAGQFALVRFEPPPF